MTSMRGSLGRPLWFEMNVTELEDTRVMILMSQLGPEGYGIHVILRLFLAQQVCNFHDISVRAETGRRNLYTLDCISYSDFRIVLEF